MSDSKQIVGASYQRLLALGPDRVAVLDGMLARQDSAPEVAKLIQEEWQEFLDVKTSTLVRQLNRYRAQHILPKVLLAVEAKKDDKKSKKEKKMEEGAKPDFLDVDKDGDKKEPMKKAAADKGGDKKDGKKGMSAKQEKYFGKKNESKVQLKKVVAESVETKLSFKDMVKLAHLS